MDTLKPGLTAQHEFKTTDQSAVGFLRAESARVLGTPFLILLIEMTARKSQKLLVGEGSDSVGTDVPVQRLAATPLGMSARIRTEVREVDGRRVCFRVEAHHSAERIATGAHDRFIINVARFAERVQAKRARVWTFAGSRGNRPRREGVRGLVIL